MHWKELHEQSKVVDLHNHAVLKRFLLDRDMSGSKTKFLAKLFKRGFWPLSQRSNFPLIEKGGVDVVLSTCYVPEEEWLDDQPLAKLLLMLSPSVKKRVFDPTYFNATISMMDDMEKEVEKYNEKREDGKMLVFAKNSRELNTCLEGGNIAMIHSVEGGHSLHGESCGKSVDVCFSDLQTVEEEVLQNLESLAARGVAYLTLAHFYPNQLVHPVFPYPTYGIKRSNWKKLMAGWDMNKGLTSVGAKVVQRMIDLGMLIDIAHCTPKARREIYEIVGDRKNCVFSSHTGCFEINRDPYNLEDWELKWIADSGGVAGIIFMNYWLSPIDTPLGLKYIEQTISHIRDVAGAEAVGLGTDYDGFTDPPDEMVDISELPRLTRYLSSLERYTDEEIKGFLGGNSLRLLMNGWGV
jgi:microsomal dipeptidase-like Zn-dependent dipeptidase